MLHRVGHRAGDLLRPRFVEVQTQVQAASLVTRVTLALPWTSSVPPKLPVVPATLSDPVKKPLDLTFTDMDPALLKAAPVASENKPL